MANVLTQQALNNDPELQAILARHPNANQPLNPGALAAFYQELAPALASRGITSVAPDTHIDTVTGAITPNSTWGDFLKRAGALVGTVASAGTLGPVLGPIAVGTGITSAASGLSHPSAGTRVAPSGTTSATGGTASNTTTGSNTPGVLPQGMLDLLANAASRQQYQNPLFQAVTNQAYQGLPGYARQGTSMGSSLPSVNPGSFQVQSPSGSGMSGGLQGALAALAAYGGINAATNGGFTSSIADVLKRLFGGGSGNTGTMVNNGQGSGPGFTTPYPEGDQNMQPGPAAPVTDFQPPPMVDSLGNPVF